MRQHYNNKIIDHIPIFNIIFKKGMVYGDIIQYTDKKEYRLNINYDEVNRKFHLNLNFIRNFKKNIDENITQRHFKYLNFYENNNSIYIKIENEHLWDKKILEIDNDNYLIIYKKSFIIKRRTVLITIFEKNYKSEKNYSIFYGVSSFGINSNGTVDRKHMSFSEVLDYFEIQ